MKILYVGNFRFATPGEPEIAKALEKLGHEVTRLEEERTWTTTLATEVEKGYDMLLYAKFRVGNPKDVAAFLQSCKIPKVCWLFDLYWGIPKREATVLKNPYCFMKYSDIVFTTDGGHDKEFTELGINHVALRQGINDEEAILVEKDFPTKARVGFVGTKDSTGVWPYRNELILFLRRTYGEDFHHFGSGPKDQVRGLRLNSLLQTLSITIGDSVYSPRYWSNRVYETLGRAGFLIMPKIEGFDEEFTPYEHYVPYNFGDFKGLQQKIDYYLTHDEERERIRSAGYRKCIKDFTYLKRTERFLEILKEKNIIHG